MASSFTSRVAGGFFCLNEWPAMDAPSTVKMRPALIAEMALCFVVLGRIINVVRWPIFSQAGWVYSRM